MWRRLCFVFSRLNHMNLYRWGAWLDSDLCYKGDQALGKDMVLAKTIWLINACLKSEFLRLAKNAKNLHIFCVINFGSRALTKVIYREFFAFLVILVLMFRHAWTWRSWSVNKTRLILVFYVHSWHKEEDAYVSGFVLLLNRLMHHVCFA